MIDGYACSDCGQDMENGFIVDEGHLGSMLKSRWHGGEPAEVSLLGIKMAGYKIDPSQMVPITAWRCTGCGLLKIYALRESGKG